ncbi:MAG: uncharacterized protein KVP18_000524 [Porospora cf. gigantea A]|uniref:uncharacterized protein n=2 Tax=Porospora cf. gigantea A TaxID=2853593 RepID=UPI003559A203|nr:MAG: hypothetical protein KVP18_000524 [Porospora cf. gigantea A]
MKNQKVKKTGQGMSWPKQMGEDSDDAPLPSVNVHFYHKDINLPLEEEEFKRRRELKRDIMKDLDFYQSSADDILKGMARRHDETAQLAMNAFQQSRALSGLSDYGEPAQLPGTFLSGNMDDRSRKLPEKQRSARRLRSKVPKTLAVFSSESVPQQLAQQLISLPINYF